MKCFYWLDFLQCDRYSVLSTYGIKIDKQYQDKAIAVMSLASDTK
ncbi:MULTISPECIES: hypothetical protein [unclassified Tolypothrix]|nr:MULTISPECIES: hypothetical protein [unclassified Tolypothrix]EKF03371.1 hypothetical protein FDUTEX481_02645 [Tolypothrix sp. PCC 7601]